MKLLTTLLLVLLTSEANSQNLDLIGTWENNSVMTGNSKKEELADSLTFKSVLSMNADSTFTLVTSGFEIVMGKFKIQKNFIVFYKLVGFEDYQRFWDIRLEEGQVDPFPDTPEIDMMLPTQALVQNKKKKKPFTSQVYVFYTKIEE